MFKVLCSLLLVTFLYGASCQTGQLQASAACVSALAALGLTIFEDGGGSAGTFDLSSVLAALLANGQDISGVVSACSAVFAARNPTTPDLGLTVLAKAPAHYKASAPHVQQKKPMKVRLK